MLYEGTMFDDPCRLFNKTSSLLDTIYRSNKYDAYLPTQKYVERVNVKMSVPATAKEEIWEHIKNKHQPVVVVMDSNNVYELYHPEYYSVSGMTDNPTLHYEVIVGIYQDSSCERYFYVYDPWNYDQEYRGLEQAHKCRVDDFINSMTVNSHVKPRWVYEYASDYNDDYFSDKGCYYMLVNE